MKEEKEKGRGKCKNKLEEGISCETSVRMNGSGIKFLWCSIFRVC
jgi:hypothetical protein